MHEVVIANSLLDTVRMKAAEFPQSRPARVGVRVGEWSGVNEAALQFCIESLASQSDLDGLRVEIETLQNRYECTSCGWEFRVGFHAPAGEIHCPYCNSHGTKALTGGTELDVSFVEWEE